MRCDRRSSIWCSRSPCPNSSHRFLVMPETVQHSLNFAAASAEIYMISAICVILLVDVFLSERSRWVTYALSLLALAGAAFVTVNSGVSGRVTALEGAFISDPM